MKRIICVLFNVFFTANAFALVNENIVNGCNNPRRFDPVFQINTYTCNPGYFLPADTLGCQPCPAEHTCSGGTFNYNPLQSQGIQYSRPIRQNVSKACSTNFGIRFWPRFQPNTVVLTFDDGDNTINGTCTYDGLITLPDEPSRPGYVFRGWQLTNND